MTCAAQEIEGCLNHNGQCGKMWSAEIWNVVVLRCHTFVNTEPIWITKKVIKEMHTETQYSC